MKNNILKKLLTLSLTATMLLSTTAFSVSAVEDEKIYIIDEFLDNKHGVTMEIATSDYEYLDVKEMSYYYDDFKGYKKDYIESIYEITAHGYYNWITQLIMEATVKIEHDSPDLYIIDINDPKNPVDVQAKYVDGKYEFKTDHLGHFVLSTKPLEKKTYTLKDQTITDKDTGVVIQGMLPENVDLDVRIVWWDHEYIDDTEEPNKFSDGRFCVPNMSELYTHNFNSNGNFYDAKDWLDSDYSDLGACVHEIDIAFYDEFKLLDVDSELTVTLPIDYRKFAEASKTDSNVMVFKSNPEENTLKGLEVLSKENSPEGSIVFKTNSTGSFFMGNNAHTNSFLSFFDSSLDEVEVYGDTNTPDSTQPTEATEPEKATEAFKATEPTDPNSPTENATAPGDSKGTSPDTGRSSLPFSVAFAGIGVILSLIAVVAVFTIKIAKRKIK